MEKRKDHVAELLLHNFEKKSSSCCFPDFHREAIVWGVVGPDCCALCERAVLYKEGDTKPSININNPFHPLIKRAVREQTAVSPFEQLPPPVGSFEVSDDEESDDASTPLPTLISLLSQVPIGHRFGSRFESLTRELLDFLQNSRFCVLCGSVVLDTCPCEAEFAPCFSLRSGKVRPIESQTVFRPLEEDDLEIFQGLGPGVLPLAAPASPELGSSVIAHDSGTKRVRTRAKKRSQVTPATKGYCYLSAVEPKHWPALSKLMPRPTYAQFLAATETMSRRNVDFVRQPSGLWHVVPCDHTWVTEPPLDALLGEEDEAEVDFDLDTPVGASENGTCWKVIFPEVEGSGPKTVRELLDLAMVSGPISRKSFELSWTPDGSMLHVSDKMFVPDATDKKVYRGWISRKNLTYARRTKAGSSRQFVAADSIRRFARYVPERPKPKAVDVVTPVEAVDTVTPTEAETQDYLDIEVGIFTETFASAAAVNGADLGKAVVGQAFNAEASSMSATKYILSDTDLAKATEYVGPVRSLYERNSNSPHLLLQVARELLREDLFRLFPHNTDMATVLHVGCTGHDLQAWFNHLGHDFLFNLVESKDAARTIESVRTAVAKKAKAVMPKSMSRDGKPIRISFNNLTEQLRFLELGGRTRFFSETPAGAHDVLIFEDSTYSMGAADIVEYFEKTGATVGYATQFVPFALIDPKVAPSTMYDLEYYYQEVETVAEFIDKIWPTVMIFFPLLPLGRVAMRFDQAIRELPQMGFRLLMDWFKRIADDAFPLAVAFGSVSELVKFEAVFFHIAKLIKPFVQQALRRVRLTWKNGYENGYEHSEATWTTLLRNPRLPCKSGGYIDSEIVSRRGEMVLFKLWRSQGETPITRCVGLPPSMAYVQLLDLEKSVNIVNGKPVWKSSLVYFSVHAQTVWKVLNFSIGEPADTLTPALMQNAVNRISGGLSIGANVIAEKAPHEDEQTAKIALTLLMETFRRQDVIGAIAADPELRSRKETNLASIGKWFAKVGALILTGGLAVPIYYLFDWLFSESETAPNLIIIPGKVAPVTVRTKFSGRNPFKSRTTILVPSEKNEVAGSCSICEMHARGKFSSNGNPAEGQLLTTSSHANIKPFDIGFTDQEQGTILGLVMAARIFHEGKAGEKLLATMKRFYDWVDLQRAGFSHKVDIEYLFGAPGTGKTEALKSIMAVYQDAGKLVSVFCPFSRMLKDYTNASVLGVPGKRDFMCDTPWYVTERKKIDILVVDECGAADWPIVRAAACFLGVSKLIFAGDKSQTVLRDDGTEGQSIYSPNSNFPWPNVPAHELYWNFRFKGSYRQKALNDRLGYNCRTRAEGDDSPKFISHQDSLALPRPELQMVFSHDTAPHAFGTTSTPGPDSNMSVRSKQGATSETSWCSAWPTEFGTITAHGMLNVSGTRSKEAPVYVYQADDTSESVQAIKTFWGLNDPAEKQRIEDSPWPPLPRVETAATKLDGDSQRAANLLSKMRLNNQITTDDPTDVLMGVVQIEGEAVDLSRLNHSSEHTLELWHATFHSCLYDSLKTIFPGIPDELFVRFYTTLFDVDHLFGLRDQQSWDHWKSGPFKDIHTLPKVTNHTGETKYMVPHFHLGQFLADNNFVVWIYQDGTLWRPKSSARVSGAISVTDGHATPHSETITMRYSDSLMDFDANPWDLVDHDGKQTYAVDVPIEKGTDYHLIKHNTGLFNRDEYMARDIPDAEAEFSHIKRTVHDFPEELLVFNRETGERLLMSEAYKAVAHEDTFSVASTPGTDYTLETGSDLGLDNISVADNQAGPIPFTAETVLDHLPMTSLIAQPARLLGSLVANAHELAEAALVNRRTAQLIESNRRLAQPAAFIVVVPEAGPTGFSNLFSGAFPKVRSVFAINKITPDDHIPAHHKAYYSELQPISSSFRTPEPPRPTRGPLGRVHALSGYDSHRLVKLVDAGSAANRSYLNEPGIRMGAMRQNRMVLPFDVHFQRTSKAKALTFHRQRIFYAAGYGLVNRYGNQKAECLNAAGRIAQKKPKPKLGPDQHIFVRKVVDQTVKKLFTATKLDPWQINAQVDRAIRDANRRRYYERGMAEFRNHFGEFVLFALGKQQEKPMKDGQLDLAKATQLVITSPTHINAHFIAPMRVAGATIKNSANPNLFIDDYERPADFRERFTRSIRALPSSAEFSITDFQQYDSQQNDVTLEIERQTWLRLGIRKGTIDSYHAVRGHHSVRQPGVFKARMNGEKASGFLDTKSGNTILALNLASYAATGIGPELWAAKGDDVLHVQTGAGKDPQRTKELKTHAGMVSVSYGSRKGGEFIGESVNRYGMYPSITRAALKAISKPAANYKVFAAQQQSYRDKIKEWARCGWKEIVHYSAEAENVEKNFVETCKDIVASLAHIDQAQWEKLVHRHVTPVFHPRSAEGAVSI